VDYKIFVILNNFIAFVADRLLQTDQYTFWDRHTWKTLHKLREFSRRRE
jgi:hypothetical protein